MKDRIEKLRTQINELVRRDPKKAVILGVLLLVMAVMWARATTGTRDKVVAATTAAIDAVVPGNTAKKNQPSLSAPAPAGREALREWIGSPINNVERNIFAVRLQHFAREGDRQKFEDQFPGFWDEVAKSMASQADQRQQRSILVENIRRDALSLKLQSTVMSDQPRALVNGLLVEAGAVISQFRILKIESRSMIVERDGVILEIQMK